MRLMSNEESKGKECTPLSPYFDETPVWHDRRKARYNVGPAPDLVYTIPTNTKQDVFIFKFHFTKGNNSTLGNYLFTVTHYYYLP